MAQQGTGSGWVLKVHDYSTKMRAEHTLRAEEFSLVSGGLLFRLLAGAGLIKPGITSLMVRIAIFSLITWVPLLLLAAWQGLAWGGKVRIPFLLDFVAHTRFLITAPLLIAAEIVVDGRVNAYIRHFVSSGLVPKDELPDYESALAEAARLRDLWIVEVLCLALAIAVAWLRAFNSMAAPGSSATWFAAATESGVEISLAGWWHVLLSVPLFQFLLYRWFWRVIIWGRFLWRMSRLRLELIPTHADLAGGLGFLGITPTTFGIIPFALATLLSAILGKEIIYNGASLFQFEGAIIGFVALSMAINFGPLLVFVDKLVTTKRKGMLAYGRLLDQHDRAFWRKWVSGADPAGETPLGNPDPSSLADLGAGYERIRSMRGVPFDLRTIIYLTATALIPLLPLLLTVYPLNELIEKIFEILG